MIIDVLGKKKIFEKYQPFTLGCRRSGGKDHINHGICECKGLISIINLPVINEHNILNSDMESSALSLTKNILLHILYFI